MLRFGKEKTLSAFNDVSHKLPARLLLALGNTAELYFSDCPTRLARPITGGTVQIPANKLLALYSAEEKMDMVAAINELFKSSMERRFASVQTDSKTMYIDSSLYFHASHPLLPSPRVHKSILCVCFSLVAL